MARESDKKSVRQKADSVADAAKKKSAEVISKADNTTSSTTPGAGVKKPEPVVIKGEATTVSSTSSNQAGKAKAAVDSTRSRASSSAAKTTASSSSNKSAANTSKTKTTAAKPKVSGSSTNTGRSTVSTSSTKSASSSGNAGSSAGSTTGKGGGGGGGSSKLGGFALGLSALALALGAWLFNKTSVSTAEQVGDTRGVQQQVETVTGQFDEVKAQVTGMAEQVDSLKAELATVKTAASDALTESKAETVDQIAEVKGQLSTEVSKIRGEDLAMLQKTQADRTEQVGEIRAEVAELSGSVEQVYAELDQSLGQWRLQEVEQLMVTANDRLNLAADVGIATTALKFADDRMRDMKDPALAEVRGSVANELSSLAAVEEVDIAGIAARLRTLQGGIDKLTMNRAGFMDAGGEAEASTEAPADDQPAEEEEKSGGVGGMFSSLVSKSQDALRKVDESTQAGKVFVPPLAPDQKFFLVENLRMQYNTAQLALFERDQDTFASSLTSATGWIEKYFQSDGVANDAIAEANKLAETSVNPELPDISGSLRELRKVIQTRAAQ